MNILRILFLCLFTVFTAFAVEINSEYGVLIDFDTGDVLYDKKMNERTNPSSMTKIMTAYLVFQKLNDGEINLNDSFNVTYDAWKQEGSRMFLMPNSAVTVDNLLKGLIVQSGNDASITLANGIAENVANFVALMNEQAKKLDLKNTNFNNPAGFSEFNHYMSVYDIAVLSRYLIRDYPLYYNTYFSILSFKWNKITQHNRNKLLKIYDGADGLKTGHTNAGGYGIATSSIRNGKRLISVVNGAKDEIIREKDSEKLLNYGFSLRKHTLFTEGSVVETLPVLYGDTDEVNIVAEKDIYAWVDNDSDILPQIIIYRDMVAPLKKDEKAGEIIINNRNYNLLIGEDVNEVNMFIKIWRKLFN
ncbi:MAG: D-alanyl-D-alanine carboxypeptidase [Rickettsiales bacterium]|jgi:D-alanyl-D-alanine carboxypeptidase (penicillin-binding protein 5/6)|nr:D-alanyl-D-alanine carboxypeptidase [Rickettsiales bacterium]